MSLEKIEQTASGAVACQLMDKFFPCSVQMKRVNWEAKCDFQFIENYKILQAAFATCNIQKHIDVDRLVRAKYQDNLEFCQWLKAFFEQVSTNTSNSQSKEYDPVARRMLGKGGMHLDPIFMPSNAPISINRRPNTSAGSLHNSIEITSIGRPSLGNFSTTSSALSNSTNLRRSSMATTASSAVNTNLKRNLSRPPMPFIGVNTASSSQTIDNTTSGNNKNKRVALMKENSPIASSKELYSVDLDSKVNQLMDRNAELQLRLESVENERNFYFEKLRGIELMIQLHGISNAENVIADISRVLCAKEDDGMIITDDGEVTCPNSQSTSINVDEALVTEAETY